MEDEPKQPCKTCGPTNWNPQQTRRDLFKNVAVAGFGLATATAFLTASTPVNAAPAPGFDIGQCLGDAEDAYHKCMDAADALPVDSIWDGIKQTRARAKCLGKRALAEGKCYKQLADELATAVKDFIRQHPYLVAGAIVIILGVAFVVVIVAAAIAPVLVLA